MISISSKCRNVKNFFKTQQQQLETTPQQTQINPVARVLLAGMLDPTETSPLSALSVCPDLLENIYKYLLDYWKEALIIGYSDRIQPCGITYFTDRNTPSSRAAKVSLAVTDYVNFPTPKNLHCNMLPFILGQKSSIPEEYHQYYPLIEKCPIEEPQHGKVCYLTIHESLVEPGSSQRRPGIHTEGYLQQIPSCTRLPAWHPWGMGVTGSFTGGIFMASNVDDSSRIWNARLPRQPSAALGVGCDLEHLRGILNSSVQPFVPKAGDLCWITDATPHESLPVEVGTYRQFFRVVTSEVGVWWERHSTKNRLGIQPACRVLSHSKFEAQ